MLPVQLAFGSASQPHVIQDLLPPGFNCTPRVMHAHLANSISCHHLLATYTHFCFVPELHTCDWTFLIVGPFATTCQTHGKRKQLWARQPWRQGPKFCRSIAKHAWMMWQAVMQQELAQPDMQLSTASWLQGCSHLPCHGSELCRHNTARA